ncbi:hypothetical protein LCGC14_1710680 [marine sediment metagenome]|uniref:Uncharacterized protein n=1 Tax=marine sediment metagenome TaxID=412755 RepID=A0A0F9KFB1_9ZZZZ
MSDVAKMLEEAVVKGDGSTAVGLAMAVAPNALLGIGVQTGMEFALQYPTAATKFLERARESEDSLAEELGAPRSDKPKVCSRIAAALFSIVEGEDNGD